MIKRLIRGARYSEKYGSHPGTPLLIALVFMGALGGVYTGDWRLSVFVVSFLLYFFLTLRLIGWWSREDRE